MINADTKEVWDSTYAAAISVTVPHPQRHSELPKIYNNPRAHKVQIERQVCLGKQRRELEMKNNQTRKRFKSFKAGQRGLIETEAKK
eukprot:12146868-Ditylum_brightwellii.AAC.1